MKVKFISFKAVILKSYVNTLEFGNVCVLIKCAYGVGNLQCTAIININFQLILLNLDTNCR